MPSRQIILLQDTYYHVYNRGFNKQKLFFNETDYKRFYKTVQRYLVDYSNIEIVAFCFLPNHFHFLLCERSESPDFSGNFTQSITSALSDESWQVRTPEAAEQLSGFMRKVQQSYAMYFNENYKDKINKGLKLPVFEGRFKAKEVLDESYLEQLVTYIEQNAVKHEMVKDPKDWAYSSWSAKSKDALLGVEFDPLLE